MNTNWQWLGRLLLIFVGTGLLCQCTPERTVISQRQTGYKFMGHNDGELESNKKKSPGANRIATTNKNEKSIKNSKGEVIRTEKRDDLYSDRSSATAQETGRSFDGKKQAKLKQSSMAKKEFKTPEYLKRQQFATKSYNEGSNQQARESNQETQFVKKLFDTKSSDMGNKAARENGSVASRFDKDFATSSNRTGTKAQKNAAIPTGAVQGLSGYKENMSLSVDDVRKMVSPDSIR